MAYIYSFEKLEVWQEARKFNKVIYLLTDKFPKEERYGLSSQIQRAAVSVASNICEGNARASYAERLHFVEIAYASLMEVLNQLYLSLDLGYIQEQDMIDARAKVDKIASLLSIFRNQLIQIEQNKRPTDR